MRPLRRLAGVVGIALAQLRYERGRTLIAIAGIALAVLATVLLASTGVGVLETGEQKFDASGRDLWITGGPIQFAPGTTGGFENTVVDSHEVAREIERREDVDTAVPMAFQNVYVSANGSEFETVMGVGTNARGSAVEVARGREFQHDDVHYANGSYDGPMTNEVVLDPRTAALLNASVNDTVHVGGTLATARRHNFTVVGISPTFSQFVGAPTVTLHLSELQEVTGTTASDRATFVSVDLTEGADPAAVERDLASQYPDYEVRTNQEQLEATLYDQAVVLASGASLVVLAVVAGLALTVNLQFSVIYQRREQLAAVKAIGGSVRTLVGITLCKALVIGALGGLVGLAATKPGVAAVNRLAAALTGFESIVSVSDRILLGGFAMAVAMSAVGAVVGGLLVSRLAPLRALD